MSYCVYTIHNEEYEDETGIALSTTCDQYWENDDPFTERYKYCPYCGCLISWKFEPEPLITNKQP